MEFLLRVKQAHNKNFSFLMPGAKLHPFFRWLVDENPSLPQVVISSNLTNQCPIQPDGQPDVASCLLVCQCTKLLYKRTTAASPPAASYMQLALRILSDCLNTGRDTEGEVESHQKSVRHGLNLPQMALPVTSCSSVYSLANSGTQWRYASSRLVFPCRQKLLRMLLHDLLLLSWVQVRCWSICIMMPAYSCLDKQDSSQPDCGYSGMHCFTLCYRQDQAPKTCIALV